MTPRMRWAALIVSFILLVGVTIWNTLSTVVLWQNAINFEAILYCQNREEDVTLLRAFAAELDNPEITNLATRAQIRLDEDCDGLLE